MTTVLNNISPHVSSYQCTKQIHKMSNLGNIGKTSNDDMRHNQYHNGNLMVIRFRYMIFKNMYSQATFRCFCDTTEIQNKPYSETSDVSCVNSNERETCAFRMPAEQPNQYLTVCEVWDNDVVSKFNTDTLLVQVIEPPKHYIESGSNLDIGSPLLPQIKRPHTLQMSYVLRVIHLYYRCTMLISMTIQRR